MSKIKFPPGAIPSPENPSPPMLISEISRLHHHIMRRNETDGVMSQDSCRLIMRNLAYNDGVTQKTLVTATHLKAPTVSIALMKMEDEGYVTRESDGRDKRAVIVRLTEKGYAFHNDIIARLECTDSRMMRGIGSEEAEMLKELLLKIRNNLLEE